MSLRVRPSRLFWNSQPRSLKLLRRQVQSLQTTERASIHSRRPEMYFWNMDLSCDWFHVIVSVVDQIWCDPKTLKNEFLSRINMSFNKKKIKENKNILFTNYIFLFVCIFWGKINLNFKQQKFNRWELAKLVPQVGILRGWRGGVPLLWVST